MLASSSCTRLVAKYPPLKGDSGTKYSLPIPAVPYRIATGLVRRWTHIDGSSCLSSEVLKIAVRIHFYSTIICHSRSAYLLSVSAIAGDSSYRSLKGRPAGETSSDQGSWCQYRRFKETEESILQLVIFRTLKLAQAGRVSDRLRRCIVTEATKAEAGGDHLLSGFRLRSSGLLRPTSVPPLLTAHDQRQIRNVSAISAMLLLHGAA